MRAYIALIRKADGTCYGVDFPDFPGCVSAGDTLEEALEGAREALALYVEDMVAEGEALPAPSDLDEVMADPRSRDAVAALVSAPEGARRWRRVNITMDEDLLARIDSAAGKGRRSEFLEKAARLHLHGVADTELERVETRAVDDEPGGSLASIATRKRKRAHDLGS